jgi:hypothetical protein
MPAERRLLTQRTQPVSRRLPHGPKRKRTSAPAWQAKAPYQCCEQPWSRHALRWVNRIFTFPLLQIAHAKLTQLFPAQAVI